MNKCVCFFGIILILMLTAHTVTAYDDRAVQYYNEGNHFFELGQDSEAWAFYDRAIAINPDFAEAWYNRGLALEKLGRYNEAIVSFDEALTINPGFTKASENRKIVLEKLIQTQQTSVTPSQKQTREKTNTIPLIFAPIGAIVLIVGVPAFFRRGD